MFEAKSAVLVEQLGGKILSEYNSHEKFLAPASATKIMTMLAVEALVDSGKMKDER